MPFGLDHDLLGDRLAVSGRRIVGSVGSDARSDLRGLRSRITAVDSIYASIAGRDRFFKSQSAENSSAANTPLHSKRARSLFFDSLAADSGPLRTASLRRLRMSHSRLNSDVELAVEGLGEREIAEGINIM